jgi:hypothetical protein
VRPPTRRQIPTVVLVRVASVAPTSQGSIRTYVNTLRRASVQEMNAAARTLYGLSGSVRAARLLFGPPDPNPDDPEERIELILIPPVLAADPDAPRPGALWVNSTEGMVKLSDGTTTAILTTVDALYTTPIEVAGPDIDDLGGEIGSVLEALGPAEDSARLGVQYRVDATEQE